MVLAAVECCPELFLVVCSEDMVTVQQLPVSSLHAIVQGVSAQQHLCIPAKRHLQSCRSTLWVDKQG